MYEIKESSEKAKYASARNYDTVTKNIPWDKLNISVSVYISYSELYVFSSKAHALNYLRTISNRRGAALGLKLKVIDHADENKIEISCYEKQEATGFKKRGRPSAPPPPEDRAGRYSRASAVINETFKLPPFGDTEEYHEASYLQSIEIAKLFNQYESEVENPHYIDISMIKRQQVGGFANNSSAASGWSLPKFVNDDNGDSSS